MDIFKLLLLIAVSALLIFTPYTAVLAGGEEAVNPVDLYEKKCSICHVIERSKSKRKSGEGWRNTVMRMKGKGAPITDEEAEIIIKHLTDNYGK